MQIKKTKQPRLQSGYSFVATASTAGILSVCKETVLASGDRDHILSGVFSQFLSEKSEPAE